MEVICDECLYLINHYNYIYYTAAYCCFTLVQLHTSRQPSLGKQAELRNDELVELWWGQQGLSHHRAQQRSYKSRTSLGHNCILCLYHRESS